MIGPFEALVARMPPLKQRRNPTKAAVVGFLFGPIGLIFYFHTFVDSLAAILIGGLAVVLVSNIDSFEAYFAGLFVSWAVSDLWAYFRVVESNRQLDVRLARGVRGLLRRMFLPR